MASYIFCTIFLSLLCLVASDKWYVIKNPVTEVVVEATTGGVSLQVFNGSPTQLWQPRLSEDVGLFFIANKEDDTRLLNVANRGAVRWVYTGVLVPNYKEVFEWYLDSDGTIVSDNHKAALDVYEPSCGDNLVGCVLITAIKNGNFTQQFVFEEVSEEQ